MVFTEVKRKKGKKYYYRSVSTRDGARVTKKRIYLGVDLDARALTQAELGADKELGLLSALLSQRDIAYFNRIKSDHAKKSEIASKYEAFTAAFTHDSTAIEGNTLTLQETGSLLFEDISPSGKPMKDISEAIGHREAFDYMLRYDGKITKKFICELHTRLMKDSAPQKYREMVGMYRTVPVYIRGADWSPPAPENVPGEMRVLLSLHTRNMKKIHPVVAAIYFHTGFEMVHPFFDGNGRVGRLLFNYILHIGGYPMLSIPNARKNRYYGVLAMAQTEGNLRPFIDFIIELYADGRVKY
jgi:Fic family protein